MWVGLNRYIKGIKRTASGEIIYEAVNEYFNLDLIPYAKNIGSIKGEDNNEPYKYKSIEVLNLNKNIEDRENAILVDKKEFIYTLEVHGLLLKNSINKKNMFLRNSLNNNLGDNNE